MSLTGVKFRAYPTSQQKRILSQWMGCARFIYNAKCSEDRYFRIFLKKSLSLTGHPIPVDQSYSQFKSEATAFLSECPSQILRNSTVLWYRAYQRFFQGLSGRPVPKKKGRRESIWLTAELFRLEQTESGSWTLFIGTKTKNIGQLRFYAHREFRIPQSVTISQERGEYYVSFNYEEGQKPQDPWVQVQELLSQGEAVLNEASAGFDRGVVIKVQSSSGESYALTPGQEKTIQKKEKRIHKNQKRQSRQKKGSNRQKKTQRALAKDHAKVAHVRDDYAHQSSHRMVSSEAQVLIWEALGVVQMSKRPKVKQDQKGRYLANGAKAKAGLNAAILSSCWGQILRYVGYKALRKSKLVIVLSPYQSSQECVKCHHTHPDNRKSQSLFLCSCCGYTENADKNASDIMKYRGVKALLEIPREHWEETSKGSGIWKIVKPPAGTRVGA
jgi:putative transposase